MPTDDGFEEWYAANEKDYPRWTPFVRAAWQAATERAAKLAEVWEQEQLAAAIRGQK